MAEMFLYNGVKLPAAPYYSDTVKTAAIFYSTVEDVYVLYYTDGRIYGPSPRFVAAGVDIYYRSYVLTDGAWVFKDSNSGLSAALVFGNDILTSVDYMEFVWSSTDILANSGSTEVTFPASTPVPAYCLTFSSPEPFTLSVYNKTKNWDGTLYYSTDGNTWPEWDGSTTLSSAEIDGENKLFMRGSGNSVITGENRRTANWVLTGNAIQCEGNIENLLDYETVENGSHPDMANYCYQEMFRCCECLTSSPELAATKLSANCYDSMFENCISLAKAPVLPATDLAIACYRYMFWGCTGLTQIPNLPAITLFEECYKEMFYGCSGIKISDIQSSEYQIPYRIPTSGTGSSAYDALWFMFYNTGGTFTGTPEINTTYYLYDPNYQPELPKLNPRSLMLGYLAGQKARALRRKLANTEDITDTDFTITGQLDVTYSHDESKALLGDRSVFGEQYGAGTFIVSEVCAMTYRNGHLIVEGDLYDYDTAESSETAKPESE